LNRPDRNTPEIQRSDLAEIVLLLHSLGIRSRGIRLARQQMPGGRTSEALLKTLGALTDSPSTSMEEEGAPILNLPASVEADLTPSA